MEMVSLFMPLLIYINCYVLLKILTQDRTPRLKESIYIFLTGLLINVIFVLFVLAQASIWIFQGILDGASLLFLSLYLYRWRRYTLPKAIILILIVMLFIPVVDLFLTAALAFFFGPGLVMAISYFPLKYMFTITAVFLFVKFSMPLRHAINQSQQLQKMLLGFVLLLVVSVQVLVRVTIHMGATPSTLIILAGFFVIYLAISFASFILFANSMKARYEVEQKEAEQRALLYYTNEIERQNAAVRKFKHDYQNILLSLKGFIRGKDLAGLEAYYTSKIEVASEIIIKEDFLLANLSKIQVSEIKSIFAAKLMLAQSVHIEASFEADREIDDFYVDSVALVRIIGILMDNAIEALSELPDGKLLVGCFKDKSGISVIVQNTCRADLKFHELLREGFSTKGEGRGLGLNNLQEIVDSHENLTMETTIAKSVFTQTLRIGGG